MLVAPENISVNTPGLGPKTINLRQLMILGLNVPEFCAVPTETVKLLADKSPTAPEFTTLLEEAKGILSGTKFVVRSSALNEDTASDSLAGQYLTKIDITWENIPAAILEVIADAASKLNGDLNQFSLIIQDYVVADTSGVCFTRDPLGNRDMVIEYHQGIGEDIVSGRVKPLRLSVAWNAEPDSKWKSEIETFKSIEQHYGHPQDIEWVISRGVLCVVQTRPITTISKEDYSGLLYLDSNLPATPFLFEKTEVSEIAPRPTELTLDLLRKIYAENGPVDKIYKKYGVKYSNNDFLKIVGNELYIDRELELQTLFPSFSYLKSGTPHFSKFSGTFRTLGNMLRLNKVDRPSSELLSQLQDTLVKPLVPDEKIIDSFMADYELIFEVNLLAAKALKTLDTFAKKEKLSSAALLLSASEDSSNLSLDSEGWLGNSLEIADETAFFAAKSPVSAAAGPNLESLGKVKQKYILPIIKKAQEFSRLREYGRWLTVKYINAIRAYAFSKAANFSDKKNIYFARINELGVTAEQELLVRKSKYDSFAKYNFPNRLTNIQITEELSLMAVSSGSAEGILKSADQMLPEDRGIVLYTKVLSPELTKYFPQISGIVSEQGGLLSHLAILAREKGLPVLVNYDNSIALGKKVKIDCDANTITVI